MIYDILNHEPMITRHTGSRPLRDDENLLQKVLIKELDLGGQVHIYAESALYRTVQTFTFPRLVRFRKCRVHTDCCVLRSFQPKKRPLRP
jgi:hypothetical protein